MKMACQCGRLRISLCCAVLEVARCGGRHGGRWRPPPSVGSRPHAATVGSRPHAAMAGGGGRHPRLDLARPVVGSRPSGWISPVREVARCGGRPSGCWISPVRLFDLARPVGSRPSARWRDVAAAMAGGGGRHPRLDLARGWLDLARGCLLGWISPVVGWISPVVVGSRPWGSRPWLVGSRPWLDLARGSRPSPRPSHSVRSRPPEVAHCMLANNLAAAAWISAGVISR